MLRGSGDEKKYKDPSGLRARAKKQLLRKKYVRPYNYVMISVVSENFVLNFLVRKMLTNFNLEIKTLNI